MRKAASAPAVLSAALPPAISATTGLGTGGGAAVQPTDPSEGVIRVLAGPNASAGGSVTLTFAVSPPTLFVGGAGDKFGAISIAGQGTTSVTVSWTAQLPQGEHRLDYEWATLA